MIWLTPDVARQVFAHAKESYPNEACGMILARPGQKPRAAAISNVDPHPQSGYVADPAQLARVLSSGAAAGERIEAIYHSHPTSPAIPSERDITDWAYPDSVMLIVGRAGAEYGLTGWRVGGGRVDRVEVAIQDSRPIPEPIRNYTAAQRAALVLTAVIAAILVVYAAVSLLPPPVVP